MMTFIRGVRIWLTMFGTAQFLAREWYPTFKKFKESQHSLKEEVTTAALADKEDTDAA